MFFLYESETLRGPTPIGRELKVDTLTGLLRQAGVSVEDFVANL
jgi:hypothetical protein